MKKIARLLWCISLLLCISITVKAQPTTLFIKTNDTGSVILPNDSTIAASFNINLQTESISASQNNSFYILLPAPGSPQGLRVIIKKTNQQNNSSLNTFSWYGNVADQPGSFVLITVKNNIASGHIRTMDATGQTIIYRLYYIGNNLHRISRINQQFFKEDKTHNPVTYFRDYQEQVQSNTRIVCNDTAGIIEVLVVYTARAKEAAGGITAIETEISNCIELTNYSFENSQAGLRIALAGASEVEYEESNNAIQDRDRLQNKTDSYLDEIHTIRDDKKADVVLMIIENGGGYSGYAFIMETVSQDFSEFAFAVVQRTAAISNFTFPHELGHLFGARHNCEADPASIPFLYSHGYSAGSLETIMSNNASATRIENWSNPFVVFGGTANATGSTAGVCQAFNVQTFQNTVDIVSKFRCRHAASIPEPGGCPLWSRCFWIILIASILVVGLILLAFRGRLR